MKFSHKYPSNRTRMATRRQTPVLGCLLIMGATFLTGMGPMATQPTLDFYTNSNAIHGSDERIRVRNVSPSTDILFFGDSWIRKDSVSSLMHTRQIKKSNQNGRANLRNIDLVEKAIWCAVDLSNGSFKFDSMGSNAGTYQEVIQSQVFQDPKFLNIDSRRMDLLIVRPGGQAWSVRAVDGGPNDLGAPQDGKLRIGIEWLTSFWGTGFGPFAGPQDGDLVLGINPDDMTYFAFICGPSL